MSKSLIEDLFPPLAKIFVPADAPPDWPTQLRELVTERYRAAHPDVAAEQKSAWILQGFMEVRDRYADFPFFALDSIVLAKSLTIDCAVALPAEYFETLYVILRRASFMNVTRVRVAAIQKSEAMPSAYRVN